jgi:hypothetical protein
VKAVGAAPAERTCGGGRDRKPLETAVPQQLIEKVMDHLRCKTCNRGSSNAQRLCYVNATRRLHYQVTLQEVTSWARAIVSTVCRALPYLLLIYTIA